MHNICVHWISDKVNGRFVGSVKFRTRIQAVLVIFSIKFSYSDGKITAVMRNTFLDDLYTVPPTRYNWLLLLTRTFHTEDSQIGI